MATIHLKVNGIKGDSVATGYEDQIDCEAWSWGASQSANMHLATGGASGGSQVQDVSISKNMDLASPNLMQYCVLGKHIDEVVLTCTKSGDGQVKWLEIKMKRVIISSVSMGSSEGVQGHESISLNFGEFEMKFFPQGKDGSEGTSIDALYNISSQKEG